MTYALWPVALLTMVHTIFVRALEPSQTDDFTPVWDAGKAFLRHLPVYTANFDSVDPHYLYPPSGTLLMAPLAVITPEHARWLFIGLNVAAIVAALGLLMRMFDQPITSPAVPAALLVAFSSETVTSTLLFTNINGVVLFGEVLFLYWMLRRRDWLSGIAVGLTFAVKPVLAPLLLLPLVRGQWRILVAAIGVPAVLMGIAWPMSEDPMEFFHRTLPYITEARNYYNSAIAGNGAFFGLPTALIVLMRLIFGVLVVVALWLLWRYYRDQELFFVTTASGLLLVASWLVGSLGQAYYSMMVFPLLMSVILRNSVLRNWPAWLAVYGFLSYDDWWSAKYLTLGRETQYMRATFGWSLLIIVIFAVLLTRYLVARKQGRLAEGIDPVDLAPAPTVGVPA